MKSPALPIPIDRAMSDRHLFGAALGDGGSWQSWRSWRSVLMAAFGVPLDPQSREMFGVVAGARSPPTARVRELWCIAGRRSGKSRIAAMVAVYCALFEKHQLAVGERGMVLVLASSIDQASVVFNYITGFLSASPALKNEIASITRREITLKNGVIIGVHSNSFRTVRGRTLVAAIFDECAFWRDESSATPDVETYRAILPSLATTGGLLIGISTPYRKSGLLYAKHRDFFGVDGNDVLVIQAATHLLNPTLSAEMIAAQRSADPAAAISEWDAEFRTDIGAYLDDASIDGAIELGRPLELPPQSGVHYQAFCDASGGVGSDSYSVAIGHIDGEHAVIDLVRGTTGKFDPQTITNDYAALLKEYNIRAITGDSYASQWVVASWQANGIRYAKSELPKSSIYLECLPLFTRGLVRLPDHPKLIRELRLLERIAHRSGRDVVDHPRSGHDDHINAVCGVLNLVARPNKGEKWAKLAHADLRGLGPLDVSRSAVLYAQSRGFGF